MDFRAPLFRGQLGVILLVSHRLLESTEIFRVPTLTPMKSLLEESVLVFLSISIPPVGRVELSAY